MRAIALFLLPVAVLASEVPAETPQEPPVLMLNESQRMALINLIDSLENEAATAKANALHWYRKSQECKGRTQI